MQAQGARYGTARAVPATALAEVTLVAWPEHHASALHNFTTELKNAAEQKFSLSGVNHSAG
ncbi:MAG TPA: hypothetical protein VHN20_06845 [Beijerinckiaceae bacterium]|nr:hypothetical protein [Beijerinckiaceae bacterium]